MLCPHCGVECDERTEACQGCGAPLTSKPTNETELEWVEWITVLADRDHFRIGLAESLLQAAGVTYVTEGVNPRWAEHNEPVRICVEQKDVECAMGVLSELIGGESEA